jgi:hypothetical protein
MRDAEAGVAEGAHAEEAAGAGRGLALLLAVTAAFAAVIGARASLLAGEASGNWQQAVRQEVKAAAAAVEDIRFVYGDEAAQAFRVLEATVRAEEYRAAAEQATGATRDILLAEASAQDHVRGALLASAEVAQDARYERPDGTYDLGLRLRDLRNRFPDLVALRPDDPQAAGDRVARHAINATAVTIPLGLTFVFGALAQGFPGRRRPFLAAGVATLAAGAVAAAVVELIA